MNQDTAIGRLAALVSADVDPVLDSDQLLELLDMFAVADIYGNGSRNRATVSLYANSTAYAAGDLVRTSEFRFWECIVPGTSNSTALPTLQGLISRKPYFTSDGTVVWQDKGGLWIPSWDLNKAAEQGWLRKAGKLSDRFNYAVDNQEFNVRDRFENCLKMAAQFRKATGGVLRVDPQKDYASLAPHLVEL